MRKLWLLLSSLMLAAVLVVAGGCAPVEVERGSSPSISAWVEAAEFGEHIGIIFSQQNVGLQVAGEGKVTAVPDIALLRLGVEAEAEMVTEAQRQAAEAMDKVVKVLKGEDVSEKDIQTQWFSVYPVRRWFDREDREETIGYRVTNIVVVKIREVDKVGTIVDTVAEAGGDLTRIETISFAVDDPAVCYEEAREKAMEDAMVKAEQMANVADVKLGKPIYISEGTAYVPPIRDLYKEGAAAPVPPPTPISPGELEFQVTVLMVYEIY
jgi:uncharacterized protein YggE